jgi:hypothetical protein
LAILIPPTQKALRDAIQVNSTLWGGVYNPIIPIYSRAPAAWRHYPAEKISIEKRITGYIRAFDPDLLVDCTNGSLPVYTGTLRRPVINIDDIWRPFYNEGDAVSAYGVGIFELFDGLYKEYFEFVRRLPWKVAFPRIEDARHALFWAAAVGELPPRIQTEIETAYEGAVDIDKPELSARTYETIVQGRILFPTHINRFQLKTQGSGHRRHESYGFYMDLSKVSDIADFWNLRALGRAVIPIPKQFAELPEWSA